MTSSSNVDTYGWDTSFAIRYRDANLGIATNWPEIDEGAKQVRQSDSGYEIAAELGPWRLAEGGDGYLVLIDLPAVSGQFQHDGRLVANLKGVVFRVEIDLRYVPNPDASSKEDLTVNADGGPASVRDIFGVDIRDPQDLGALKTLFTEWLSRHLGEFNHVFHTIDFSEEIDKDPEWHFLKPTSVGYAVTDQGSLDTSVFGVLTMTGGKPAPKDRGVSPDAIPAGSNSGFVIAGPIFVRKMLLSGAALQFRQPDSVTRYPEGSPEREAALNQWISENFEISNDGMSVTNTKKITFGKFTYDGGRNIDVAISPFDFELSVNYGRIRIEFNNLSYEFSPGIVVHMHYRQHFTIELKDTKNGKVFILKNEDRSCSVNVTKSRDVVITGLVTTLALSLAGAILGGMVGEATGAYIQSIADEAEASAAITPESINMSPLNSGSSASGYGSFNEIDEEQALLAEAEVAGRGGGSFYGCFARVAPKIAGWICGSGAGATISRIPDYVKLAARNEFDDLPTFDTFANKAIQAHQWPQQKNYSLESVNLATSFQLGGTIQWSR